MIADQHRNCRPIHTVRKRTLVPFFTMHTSNETRLLHQCQHPPRPSQDCIILCCAICFHADQVLYSLTNTTADCIILHGCVWHWKVQRQQSKLQSRHDCTWWYIWPLPWNLEQKAWSVGRTKTGQQRKRTTFCSMFRNDVRSRQQNTHDLRHISSQRAIHSDTQKSSGLLCAWMPRDFPRRMFGTLWQIFYTPKKSRSDLCTPIFQLFRPISRHYSKISTHISRKSGIDTILAACRPGNTPNGKFSGQTQFLRKSPVDVIWISELASTANDGY